jgi:hypothetical protein
LAKTVDAAFFVSPVSPDSETRIGTAVWVPGVDVPLVGARSSLQRVPPFHGFTFALRSRIMASASRFLENFTSALVGCLLYGLIWLPNLGATDTRRLN